MANVVWPSRQASRALVTSYFLTCLWHVTLGQDPHCHTIQDCGFFQAISKVNQFRMGHLCSAHILVCVCAQRKALLVYTPKAWSPVFSFPDRNGTRLSQWRDQKGTGVVKVSEETERRRGIQTRPRGPSLFSGLLCDPSCQLWGYRHCAEDLKYIFLVSRSRAHLRFTEARKFKGLATNHIAHKWES